MYPHLPADDGRIECLANLLIRAASMLLIGTVLVIINFYAALTFKPVDLGQSFLGCALTYFGWRGSCWALTKLMTT